MKNIFRKGKKISPVVIRAISRLNKYGGKKTSTLITWDGKSIIKTLSITL